MDSIISFCANKRKGLLVETIRRADLKGGLSAAGGGVASYLLGCGPVGIKAWAAVILAGAAVGSIDNAIDQLWPEEE